MDPVLPRSIAESIKKDLRKEIHQYVVHSQGYHKAAHTVEGPGKTFQVNIQIAEPQVSALPLSACMNWKFFLLCFKNGEGDSLLLVKVAQV